jgi:hypothetical protein
MRIKFTITFFLGLLLLVADLHAQYKRQLSVDLNRSFHGTGDMRGVGFAVEYGRYLARKLEITGSIGSNIHHDQYPLFLSMGGSEIDASYRMVTAGIQLAGQAHFAPLRTNDHEFKIGLGPLLRYQSSSASGGYGVMSPTATSFPEPVFTFRQIEEQNMVTLGFLASVSYTFSFNSRFFVGAKASLQDDTNGEVITQYGLRIGKRF